MDGRQLMPRWIVATLGAFLLCFSATCPTRAQEVFAYDSHGTSTFRLEDDPWTRLVASWAVELRTGILMGEPVVSSRFRYRIDPGLSQVNIPNFNMGIGDQVALSTLPSAAQLKPRLYNVKILFRFSTPVRVNDVFLTSDVGDPGKGDGETWSFNVPGSPDWDKMFSITGSMSEFISAKDAKAIMTRPLELVDARIVDYDITLFDPHLWYQKHDKFPQITALLEANKHLADGIRRSTGQDVRLVTKRDASTIAGLTWVGRGAEKALAALEAEFDKLSNVPDKFIPAENPEPYRTAVADARRMKHLAYREVAAYRPPGVDPRTLPQGHEPAFGGAYEAVRHEGSQGYRDGNYFTLRRKDSPDGIFTYNQSDYVLYKGTGLITSNSVPCQNGSASFEVLDPLSVKENKSNPTIISRFVAPCSTEFALLGNIQSNDLKIQYVSGSNGQRNSFLVWVNAGGYTPRRYDPSEYLYTEFDRLKPGRMCRTVNKSILNTDLEVVARIESDC